VTSVFNGLVEVLWLAGDFHTHRKLSPLDN
jgi:hypothetical protein